MLLSATPASPKAALAAAPVPRLTLSLLGGVGVGFGGTPVPLPARKARALLAYLGIEGDGAERRERLAGLLWGESSERFARNSLRQTLLELRQALAPFGCQALSADRHEVRLSRADIALDINLIRTRLARGEVPDPPPVPDSLLAGYEDLSPLFRDWVLATRRRLQHLLFETMEEGFTNPALDRRRRRKLAELALRLDPLHEAACRVVMRLAAEDGETGVALRAYARLYESFDTELDMEPAAATQTLVAEIKQDQLAPSETAPPWLVVPPRLPATGHGPGVPVVAVLPLRAIGPEPVPVYVAEGVAEDIVSVLASLREPVVISANSTRHLTGLEIDLAQIGAQLGAGYVVSGSLRVTGPNWRLSVELAEASSGAVLWSRGYEVTGEDLFATQNRIAAAIAHTLAPQVQQAELNRSLRRPPEDLGAYHLVVQARDLVFRLEQPAFEQAGILLRRANAQDPHYAGAPAALANWYSLRLGQGWSPDPAGDAAALEAAARRAVVQDPGAARALALLGHSRTVLARDYPLAQSLFERALEAAPNDAEVWMWSSPTFAFLGDAAEAVRRAERGIALSPQDPLRFRHEHFLSIAHYAAGDNARAAAYGAESARRNPHYTSNLRMSAAAMAALGRLAEAGALAQRVLALEPGFSVARLAARLPFRDPEIADRYAKNLRAAGLPG